MIVICISDVPPSLRGDLSKWLIEINIGVYVGRVSARVREELWKRVVKNVKAGRATMVYRAQNEQGMKFRVHNSEWIPIDFDGLTLMLHPSKASANPMPEIKAGFSHAAIKLKQKSKHFLESKYHKTKYPDSYIILDIETTGLNEIENEIIEIGALRIEHKTITDQFIQLTRIEGNLPEKIINLTGITMKEIEQNGIELEDALTHLKTFIKDLPIVAHNASFDMAFIRENCLAFDINPPKNPIIDTLQLARSLLPGISHRLEDLVKHFQLPHSGFHRCQLDCDNLHLVYCKLIEIAERS